MSEYTPDEGKRCTKCGVVKPLKEFSPKGPRLNSRCKVCIAEFMRQYRATPEGAQRQRASLRASYHRHRSKRNAETAEYHRRNPADRARKLELERARYAADPERFRARRRAWREANREAVRGNGRHAAARRRARERQLPFQPYTLADIIDRDGAACVLCGAELDMAASFPDALAATIEHLECISWPDSAGDVLSNVALSHFECNNRRRDKPHPAAARKRAELLLVEQVGD